MKPALPFWKRHKKLTIFAGLIALSVAGFYIYKFSYIQIERRKYAKAEVAIKAAADDLRAQGIETTSYKECERTQGKFDSGSLSCYTGILYRGNEKDKPVKDSLQTFLTTVESNNFTWISGEELNPTRHPIIVASSVYKLSNSSLQCRAAYDKHNPEPIYTLSLECGKPTKFPLF